MSSIQLLKSRGNSMFPIFWDGDVVSFQKINPQNSKIDDIVVIATKSHYITHRIIYIDLHRKKAITKGDNNLLPDREISLNRIQGRIIKIYRNNQSINLKNYYLFQSTYYLEEIKHLIRKLEQQKIKHVFLKGLPLHLYYTGTYPQRIFSDCDILVSKNDQNKIHNIMNQLGYEFQISHQSPLHNLIKNDVHAFEYVKTKGMFKIVFDIHFKIALIETKLGDTDVFYPKKLINKFTDKLLATSEKVTIMDVEYSILNREFLIIYLATHIFHHNFTGYQRYLFLKKVIEHSQIDIKKIHSIIDNYKLTNFVFLAFLLLKKYYAPKVSETFYEMRVTQSKSRLINSLLDQISIFKDEDLFQSAFNRMRLIYAFSDTHWFLKNWVFLKYVLKAGFFIRPQTLYTLLRKQLQSPLFFYKNFFFK